MFHGFDLLREAAKNQQSISDNIKIHQLKKNSERKSNILSMFFTEEILTKRTIVHLQAKRI